MVEFVKMKHTLYFIDLLVKFNIVVVNMSLENPKQVEHLRYLNACPADRFYEL